MFTGIIEAMGRIRRVDRGDQDSLLIVEAGKLDMSATAIGDSIAVNGVCLTVVAKTDDSFSADVSAETLSVTTLGDCRAGSRVNLELALTLGKPLGGHLVSGHVDGVGQLVERCAEGCSERFRVRVPEALERYIAVKGSITLDGVSLTVNGVSEAHFEVNLIPHTLRETTLGDYRPGQRVNLEVDLLARYLERLMPGNRPDQAAPPASLLEQ